LAGPKWLHEYNLFKGGKIWMLARGDLDWTARLLTTDAIRWRPTPRRG
jgi:hypothetical protein